LKKGPLRAPFTENPADSNWPTQAPVLDEIGDLPKDMQVKILRVIQDQEFERVGGLRTIKVDVRLIAATNKTLLEEVGEGRFREDLYYRLNVFPIDIPPLRERRGDIGPLADFFLKKFNEKLNRKIEHIDPKAEEFFSHYGWRGNIRELENLMERLVLLTTGDTITLEDIPAEIRFSSAAQTSGSPAEPKRSFKNILRDKTERLEKDMIMRVLEECGGNVSKAALQLGLSRRGLQLKMTKYHLRRQDI